MTEAWFNRPMTEADGNIEMPAITRCNCKAQFYDRSVLRWRWDCPKHGIVDDDMYVAREGLQIQCGFCASYRVLHDPVVGHCECLNCWAGWDYD